MTTLVEETANKLVRDVIDLIIGIPGFTIKANQNAPRPAGLYATVLTSSITKVGREQTEITDRTMDNDVDQTIVGQRNMIFSINFYRDGAKDSAHASLIGLIRESIQSVIRKAGFGLGERSEIRSTTEALENGWEERAQFDLTLNTVATDTDLIYSILTVDIEGEFQSRGIKTNFTIEVN